MTVSELTLSQAAVAYGGTLLYPDCRFSRVSTDTRTLARGELFVALRGETYDGHLFLKEVANDACGLVVQYPDRQVDKPQWVVPDTVVALGQLAKLARDQFDGPLIALTGSSGKTTVKEMLASILTCVAPVLATRGNLNNHIGVPKTLLALAKEHRYAVLEMGASGPGEIAYLVSLARPTIALVNNVMPAHVEGFGSLAGVAAAKGEIYGGLDASGTAVINLDEPWARDWRRKLPCMNVVTFSLEQEGADVGASNIRFDHRGNPAFTLHVAGEELPVSLPAPGRHNVSNALAAAACALAAGISPTTIAAGLEAIQTVSGRMEFKDGPRGSTVIDDSYNANPGSVKAAIDVLGALDGQRLLVLGDMAELGPEARALHREVGEYAQATGIDQLLATGQLSKEAVAGFGEQGQWFADKDALVRHLRKTLDENTTALVKGSRSAAMDEVVNQLIDGGRAA